MSNHHRLFNELSAGIPVCYWKVQSKAKTEKKKRYKIFSFPHPLCSCHCPSKDPELPGFFTHLSAFLEDDVQSCRPDIVMAFSIVKHVCSSFPSFLSSPHQNEASWYVVRTPSNRAELKLHFPLAVSLLRVKVCTENLQKILNQNKTKQTKQKKRNMHSKQHLKIGQLIGRIQLICVYIPLILVTFCVMPSQSKEEKKHTKKKEWKTWERGKISIC